jgi:glycerol-3-phosphate dehydrogenase
VTRHLRSLSETEFDVLVIGAGIYGATIAWDAAQRGLSVAVIHAVEARYRIAE